MKTLTLILSFYFALTAIGQSLPDSGFTNRSEAKNETVNGVKQGKWIEFVDNGDRPVASEKDAVYCLLIVYKDGLPFGIVRKYDIGQLFWSIPYKDGKKNGIMKKYYFYDRGVKSEIPYVNDTITGIVRDYYESTHNLKCVTSYEHNWMNGMQKNYRTDGVTVSSEITFTGGKRNGMTKVYYEDGKLQYEIPYNDDKKNGVVKMYMENGILAWEATYINGRLDDTSVKAPKVNLPDSIKKIAGHVGGFVKIVHPWCNDVVDEHTAAFIKPKPFPNKKMFVKRGDSNDFSKPILMEFTTDSNGSFQVSLPPGAYIIISENKRHKPNYDSLLSAYANGSKYCRPITASDTICMTKWYRTPDAAFIVGNNSIKDVTIIYNLPCSEDCGIPCLVPRYLR